MLYKEKEEKDWDGEGNGVKKIEESEFAKELKDSVTFHVEEKYQVACKVLFTIFLLMKPQQELLAFET